MARRVAVRGIALHDGKLLCVRLKRYAGSLRAEGSSDYWCLPGGGLEDGEPLLAGIEREMTEETGIKPAVGNLLYVQQFIHGHTEHLEFFFHITNGADYQCLDLARTTHGEKEIEEAAFIDPAAVRRILPEFLASEPLAAVIESAAPTKLIMRL